MQTCVREFKAMMIFVATLCRHSLLVCFGAVWGFGGAVLVSMDRDVQQPLGI